MNRVARGSLRALVASVVLVVASDAAFAAQPTMSSGCDAFTWNVASELALMREPALAVDAGKSAQSAPKLELGKHYAAHLSPQQDVQLAAAPGKPMLDDGARAGLFAFRVDKAGTYRVTISSGHWLDVIDAGTVLRSRDFQGQRGCDAIHKIVEFDLPAGHDLLLQFSGGTDADIGVAITAAPKPAK